MKADDYKAAKDLAAWKQLVGEMWNGIEVVDVDMPDIAQYVLGIGDTYQINIVIDKKTTDIDLGLEMVFASGADNNDMKVVHSEPFSVSKVDGTKVTYSVSLSLNYPGVFKFGIRLYPSNPMLPNKQDFPLMKWI